MSKAQLETLYTKIGSNHQNLQYNGQFLHIQQTGLGGFNEWSVLTYNMQLIAKFIKENSELRKKYEELLKVYTGIKQQPQQQQQPQVIGGPNNQQQDITTLMSMMLQRIEGLEKRYTNTTPAAAAPPPSIYNTGTGSWTGYGQLH